MANTVYNIARQQLSLGQIDLSVANLWVMMTLGYVPEIENHKYISDVSSYEITGSGYYRQKLENVSLTKDVVNNRMVLLASNVSWEFANFSADGAVIYVDMGNDSSSYMITFLDFGSIKCSQNTVFTIEWNTAEGIINLQ